MRRIGDDGSAAVSGPRGQQGTQVADHVGFLRILVGPVALDPGEAQRDAARVARGGLDAVERDLDHQLGAHHHGNPVALGLARQESLGLPAQQLVGQPLERLAHHDEVARLRVARAEVEVGEPAPPAAVPPFGAEHHQVVGAHRLDLAPRPAAPSRRVGRRRVLDHDALVTGSDRLVKHLLGRRGVAREDAGDRMRRCDRLEPCGAFVQRGVEEVLAVDVQDVEQERDDPLRRRPAVDLGHRELKRRGPAGIHPQRLAVEHRLADREPAHRRDDARQRVGDLVEVARVDAHLLAPAMDLDADPVQLELHRRKLHSVQGLGDRRPGRREHGEDGAEDLKADRSQPLLAVGHGDPGHLGQIAREHERAPGDRARHGGGLGHRVGHQSRQRALTQASGEQADEEGGLGLGGPAQQRLQELAPPRCRPAACRRLDLGDRAVDVLDAERRSDRRRPADGADRRVADPDASLARDPGQDPDDHRNLFGLEPSQQVGQDGHLGRARAGGGDAGGGGDDVGEQGHAITTSQMSIASAWRVAFMSLQV